MLRMSGANAFNDEVDLVDSNPPRGLFATTKRGGHIIKKDLLYANDYGEFDWSDASFARGP